MPPVAAWDVEEITDCWLDDPLPDDRRSWAVPAGHGTYRGLDLEQLDPDDEDERTFLLEAHHPDMAEALARHEEMTGPDGDAMNPTLHVSLHLVVANQLLADDPPETWQAVQRLAGLGYDWHNVMHLVMGPVWFCRRRMWPPSVPSGLSAAQPRPLTSSPSSEPCHENSTPGLPSRSASRQSSSPVTTMKPRPPRPSSSNSMKPGWTRLTAS